MLPKFCNLPLEVFRHILDYIPDWETKSELALTNRVVRAQCKRALLQQSDKVILLEEDNYSALYYRTLVHIILPVYFADAYMLRHIVLYARQLQSIRITYTKNRRNLKKIVSNFFMAVNAGGNREFKLLIPIQDKSVWAEVIKYKPKVPKVYNNVKYVFYQEKK